ncbi:hypothetical protein TNIN_30851 [Trichonephila inaurata madagascariensis]|uniref:Uncharacterized protein n=1 Tax=Trichonephila inaurata madagascariensis TaxID=2747483 RepID=A0A8X7CDP9_9ARAC|nr:hypothetical protein TNIN_30851 [Trichonephila inaurata madagascariensis]
MSAIVIPSTIDYEEFAQKQQSDNELKALLSATNQTLQLKQLRMPGNKPLKYIEIPTGSVNPYEPHAPEKTFFLAVQNPHPGIVLPQS